MSIRKDVLLMSYLDKYDKGKEFEGDDKISHRERTGIAHSGQIADDIRIFDEKLQDENPTQLGKCQRGFQELYGLSISEATKMITDSPVEIQHMLDRLVDTKTLWTWTKTKKNASDKADVVQRGNKLLRDWRGLSTQDKDDAFKVNGSLFLSTNRCVSLSRMLTPVRFSKERARAKSELYNYINHEW